MFRIALPQLQSLNFGYNCMQYVWLLDLSGITFHHCIHSVFLNFSILVSVQAVSQKHQMLEYIVFCSYLL